MSTVDRRHEGSSKPYARYEFSQQSWDTGDGHDAATATLYGLNGLVERIDLVASEVTANPTFSATLTGANDVQLATFTNLADGTNHIKLANTLGATDSDFQAFPLVDEDVTVSIDPSADPGGSDQTLTIDVALVMR